jgi:hypothetical protein
MLPFLAALVNLAGCILEGKELEVSVLTKIELR